MPSTCQLILWTPMSFYYIIMRSYIDMFICEISDTIPNAKSVSNSGKLRFKTFAFLVGCTIASPEPLGSGSRNRVIMARQYNKTP